MTVEFGRMLFYGDVVRGLQELNRDMHFDMATALGGWHPKQDQFAGVFYLGQHVCSMDRDQIPEFKIWGVSERRVEIPVDQVYLHEFATVSWDEVLPSDPAYLDASVKANTFDDGYSWDKHKDGTPMLVKNRGYRTMKGRGPIIKLGWRHTFEGILRREIPGIGRLILGDKFGVDMLKFPVGSPDEIYDALVAE